MIRLFVIVSLAFTLFAVSDAFAQEDANTYFRKGWSGYGMGNYETAIANFNKAIELNPKHALAYFYRGRCKSEIKDYKSAIEDFDKAIELEPGYAMAYFDRSQARKILGDAKGSEADIAKAQELDASLLANVEPTKKDDNKPEPAKVEPTAKPEPAKVEPIPPDKKNEGEPAVAKNPDKKPETDKKDDISQKAKALSLLDMMAKHGAVPDKIIPKKEIEAEELYNSAKKKRWTRIRPGSTAKSFNLDGALEDINKAIALNPKFASAYLERAYILSSIDERDGKSWAQDPQIMTDINRAIQLNPQYADAFRLRGAIKKYSSDYIGAASDLSQAIKILEKQNVDTKEALITLRSAYEIRADLKLEYIGDYKSAIKDYDKAIELLIKIRPDDPSSPTTYEGRGKAKLKAGDYKGALADLETAYKYNPNATYLKELLPYINEAKSHIK